MSTSGNNELITVLMPAYNASQYIREAIESILCQTHENFEFIIINDGSSDTTEETIKSFKDDRIVYVKNETNLGLIKSLNKGITLSKGNFIARMDADDISLPERLKLQLEFFRTNPEMVVVGSDYYILTDGKSVLSKDVNDSDYKKATLFFATCFAHPTVMMRNVFGKNNLFYNENFVHAEDYKLWTEFSFLGSFGNVSVPLLKYRAHSGQISEKNRETQLRISKEIRKEYIEKSGFKLSDDLFDTLNRIGNNTFISSLEKLLEAEKCYKELADQNTKHKKLNPSSFNKLIHKFWIDTCGNTNLGLKAYGIYKRSELSGMINASFSDKMKLIAKCILRKRK